MILVFRRCIILLLLVLQGFSPLVHAHVHVVNGEEDIHIHSLTTVTSHEHQFSSLDNYICSNVVIEIKSAIQKKNSLDANSNAFSAYAIYTDFSQPSPLKKEYISFSLLRFSLKKLLFLADSEPRASPPLLA